MKKTVGIIGCGYWGARLIRNFYSSEFWNLKYACDLDPRQLKEVQAHYPTVKTTQDVETLFSDSSLEAVAIATPVSTHFNLAKKSLESGKHTWVEKPLTSTSREAADLIEIASRKKLILHVDHTFIYTPAVRKIKELMDAGVLGDFYYFDSTRVNLGLFQHDINVVWDLAPHDVSILRYLVPKKPKNVIATGKCHVNHNDKRLENMAYISVHFGDESIAHFHVNWLTPVKIRQILIGGSQKMFVYNDLEPMEKIKVYDTGVDVRTREDVYHTLVQYRTGDMYSPKVENLEALKMECRHFFESIRDHVQSDTDGEAGLYVVKILEAASESLKKDGAAVKF